MPRWILYGTRTELESRGIGEGYDDVEVREPVATFDSREQAEDYIRASKKRSYQDYMSSWRYDNIKKQFKAKSLLYYFAHAEVEEETELPHNPELL